MSDPFKITGPAVVSFSGGRTSGYMLWRILQAHGGKLPDDVKVVFCNTGKERPETLDFVERCSAEWDVPVVWLEYRYDAPVPCPTRAIDWPTLDDDIDGERTKRWDAWHEAMTPIRTEHVARVKAEMKRRKTLKRKDRKGLPKLNHGPGRHLVTIVDYATASLCGEPLEEVIAARNMLPNVVSRFCTVEAKIRSTKRFLTSLGWKRWGNAIGFRADEPQRVAKLRGNNRYKNEDPYAPLHAVGATLADVRGFWDSNSFDLQLESHEGNCDLCYLKRFGKRLRIMRERPDLAKWWIRMEAAADRRGLARNPSVALFRKDTARYSAMVSLSQRTSLPMMDDDQDESDELSVACHCTD